MSRPKLRNLMVVETETDGDRDWAKDVETESLSRVSLISDQEAILSIIISIHNDITRW